MENLIFCKIAGCSHAALLKSILLQIFFKNCANNFKLSFFHILNLGAATLLKPLSVADSLDYGL